MAKKVERGLDCDGIGLDLEQLVDRLELLVDAARRFGIAVTESSNHGLHLGSDDVRVHADAADATELEEGKDEVVVPRVQVEIGLPDDSSRLDQVVIRLLDRPDGRNVGELDDRVRLEVEHDAGRDVVDDDRPVADVGDRAEVLDDAADRRPVVVRRDDEEPVYTELVRFTRKVDGMGSGVGAGTRDDGRAPTEGVDGDAEELEPLVVAESGALAGRRGDDEPIGATLDEVLREFAKALEVDGAVSPEGRDDGGQDLA